jgi:hypothetical protein
LNDLLDYYEPQIRRYVWKNFGYEYQGRWWNGNLVYFEN